MEVKILNGGRGRHFNAAIMASALLAGKKLRVNHLHVTFDVDDWNEFCHLAFHAAAEMTRTWEGQYLKDKIHVEVTAASGRIHSTNVWYDHKDKCLRYEC